MEYRLQQAKEIREANQKEQEKLLEEAKSHKIAKRDALEIRHLVDNFVKRKGSYLEYKEKSNLYRALQLPKERRFENQTSYTKFASNRVPGEMKKEWQPYVVAKKV